MERLTQRCNCGICGSNGNVLLYPLYRIGGDEYMDHGLIKQCFEKLANYEELEEQGLLLRLPRKIGDSVWFIPKYNGNPIGMVVEDKVQMIGVTKIGFHIKLRDHQERNKTHIFGKTVFLTKEEAEEALEKMNGEEHE